MPPGRTMSGPVERGEEERLGLRAVVHLVAAEVARGDLVPATVVVRAAAGSSPRKAEWGAPVTGGIRQPGAVDPSGWFSGRVAGVGRRAILAPEQPISIIAIVGTTPIVPGRVLPLGMYQVVVDVFLNLGPDAVRLRAVGPEIRLV